MGLKPAIAERVNSLLYYNKFQAVLGAGYSGNPEPGSGPGIGPAARIRRYIRRNRQEGTVVVAGLELELVQTYMYCALVDCHSFSTPALSYCFNHLVTFVLVSISQYLVGQILFYQHEIKIYLHACPSFCSTK